MFGAIIDAASDFGQMAWSQYLNKKNMRDQAGLQYEYASRYARNSPSWNIEGLRTAGLNPILAVSNGVNLGANIPNISNSSPSGGGRGTKFTEAFNNMKQNEVALRNVSASETTAEANKENARSQAITARANMIRAEADAAKSAAQTASILQEVERDKNNGGYSNEIVADIHRILNPFWEDGKKLFKKAYEDINRPIHLLHNSATEHYLQNRPMTIEEFDRLKKSNPDFFKRNDFIRHDKPPAPKIEIRDGKKYYWRKISK